MPKPRPGDEAIQALYPAGQWADLLAQLKESTGREWSVRNVQYRARTLGLSRTYRSHGVRDGVDTASAIVRLEYPTASLPELALKLTTSTGQTWTVKDVHNAAHRMELTRAVDQRMLPPCLGIPRQPITVTSDRAVVCGDLHIPFHDREAIVDLLRVARRDKCDTIIIAGDLVDVAAFSKWDPEAPVVTWEKEVETANAILYELSQSFEHVYIIPGNHESRLIRLLKGQMSWKSIMAGWEIMDTLGDRRPTVENIPLVNLGDWALVCHAGNYSQVPGTVENKLVAKYQRSVFTGHQHHMSLRMDVSGRHLCVGLGCLTRADMTDYITMHVRSNPMWNVGWWTVIDREPRPYIKGHYKL